MARKGKKAGIPPPYALAMVIADAIWRDPATGKDTILGTFSAIRANEYPTTYPMLTVYIALTDGRGKMPFNLKLVDDDEDSEPLFSGDGEIEFGDPRAIITTVVQLGGITFPRPGEYRFQLFVGGEFIIERRLVLIPPSDEQ